jgi:hypothetical protein
MTVQAVDRQILPGLQAHSGSADQLLKLWEQFVLEPWVLDAPWSEWPADAKAIDQTSGPE